MRRPLVACALVAALATPLPAAAVPTLIPEAIYGGRIYAIRTVATGAATSQVFVTTESPNTLFAAEVTAGVVGTFEAVDGMDSDAGHGLAGDVQLYWNGSETCVYVSVAGAVYYDGYPGTTFASQVLSGTGSSINANALGVHGGRFFAVSGSQLYQGEVEADCSVTLDAPVSLTGAWNVRALRFGVSKPASTADIYVYALVQHGGALVLARSNEPVDAATPITGFTSFSTGAGDANEAGLAIAPDGRVWLAERDGGDTVFSYTDDESSFTDVTPSGGCGFPQNLRIHDDDDGDPATYRLFLGAVYSDGTSGPCYSICSTFETHPNDGDVGADPVDPNLLFMTTDQGLGASSDYGASCYEIDDGIYAVNVADIFVNNEAGGGAAAKTVAWIASKSGIFQTTNFDDTEPTWTPPAFPMGDGSPYYAVAVDPSDPENTAFVGNVRVYRTTSGPGSSTTNWGNWSSVLSEVGIGSYSLGGQATVETLAIDPATSGGSLVVFAGLAGAFAGGGAEAGGLFATCNAGGAWEQIDLGTGNTVPGPDANVKALLVVDEGGTSVLYAGLAHFTGGTTATAESFGVYRVSGTCGAWTVVSEFEDAVAATETAPLVAGIDGLAVDSLGNVFAVGGDDTPSPVVYWRDGTAGEWSSVTNAGLTGGGGPATALGTVTVGDMPDGTCAGLIPYAASWNSVYYLPMDASCATYDAAWGTHVVYPAGEQINKLFWDELVAGSSTGFASVTDDGAPPPDGGTDAGADAGTDAGGGTDAGSDAGADAGGGTDAGSDAGADAGGGTDAGSDAGTDAGGGTDAGSDAGTDAGGGTDAGADAGTDAGGGMDAGRDAATDAGGAVDAGGEDAADDDATTDAGRSSGGGDSGGCAVQPVRSPFRAALGGSLLLVSVLVLGARRARRRARRG